MPRVAGAGSRNLLLVSLLTLAGCGHAPPSSQKLLADSIRQQELGDFNAALKLAETGERSADDKDLRILFRLRRAEILLLRGKSTEARSLIPNDSPAGSEAACRARMITGWAAFLGGDMQQARVQLDEAYLNATALQNPALTARIEIRRAAVFTDSGEIAAAEASIGRALDIARQSQDELLEATALGNRGMMRLSASRFDEAIPFFERSIRLRERMGAPNARALSLLNLGYCYYRLGDFDKALELYQAARRILTELNRVADVQAVLGNIGNIHLHRKDYKTAQVYYFEALALAREVHDPTWIARWCSNLATLLIESGDYSGAKRYNNEAQAIGAKLAPSQTLRGPELNSAALASARGNYPEAIARYTSVIATEPHSPAQILDAHAGLGRTYLAMGRAEKAGAAFQETTSLLEQFRDKLSKEDYKLSYLSGLIHFHQEYVELLMSQQKTEKALEVVEASRARLLSANLGSPAGAAFRDAAAQSGASILTF
ncbi:MAG TPA: tetratricopeptide repeat protein, partial [Bryobacteraceae bacterium]|nr:tetratricopeptide repeat protein [Bryobacteraceae bacterium]